MRTTSVILKNARAPQVETKVPLKIMRPLKLRDYVSGRGDSSTGVACLQEMSVLMACLKVSEFSELPCQKEITSFQNCVASFADSVRQRDELAKKGVYQSLGKKLDHRQVNLIMKNYPDPTRK